MNQIKDKALLKMEFNTMNLAPYGQDPIDWPHSTATCSGLEYNRLRIDSDDGNQSSYGYDIWTLTDTEATCIESYGRDCFEGNISDWLAIDLDLDWTDNGVEVPFTIPIEVFRNALEQHKAAWNGRSKEGHLTLEQHRAKYGATS